MIITDIDILRNENSTVSLEDSVDIILKLEKELKDSINKGVGLAAPQIGINKKVAIIRQDNGENIDLVNPKIIESSGPFININEGCLSLPGKLVNTRRFREILIVDDLHPNGLAISGFTAVVVQHEFDHTESILITDRSIGKDKVKRNDPCPCGAKKNGQPVKFKNCHGK